MIGMESAVSEITNKMRQALVQIAQNPRKSGAFWRDLGIAPATIARLEDMGLVGATWRPATSETSILRRSWSVTEAAADVLRSHS